MITIVLLIIFLLILVLPITVKRVEHNLEAFLLVVGTVTLLFSHWLGPERLIKSWAHRVRVPGTGETDDRNADLRACLPGDS